MRIDLQPTLEGDLIVLRPLRPEHWEELYAAASDPLIWEQHPAKDRWQRDVFRRYFDEALAEQPSGAGGAFAIIEKATGQIIGSTRFHGYDSDKSEVEIGWTFLARRYWGGHYNREMKHLLLAYAFGFVERVIFLVGVNNMRSQRAMEKIGGIKCGIVEKPGSDGRMVRSVQYEIRKAHFVYASTNERE